MPLFRKKPQSQAQRLAASRLGAIPKRDFTAEIGAVVSELGVEAEQHRDAWVATIGSQLVFLKWIDADRVLSCYVGLEDTRDAAQLTDLLQRNLDPVLAWVALDDDDSLGARFKLPLDGFDREGALLGLQAVAGLVGDEAVAERARELRGGPRGEMQEQEAAGRTRDALAAGFEAADLPATERDGIWEVETERGTVQAIPRDTGESVLFMHELRYEWGTDNVDMLRWLLIVSDLSGARVGLAPLPGGEGAFAACAVPAHDLQPQAVSWGVEQVLFLAAEYDDGIARGS
jgi:hypothetical protein